MSKIDFAKAAAANVEGADSVNTHVDGAGETVTEETPTPAPALGVAVREDNAGEVSAAPVAHSNSPAVFDDQNIGFEDIILPRINIVHKVGGLSEIFNSGEIVIKQALVIYSPKKGETAGTAPLNITILGFKKTQFAEKVSGGARGILCNTEMDVAKNNGTLDYAEAKASVEAAKDGGGKALRYFERLATAMLLIEKPAQIPDTDHIEFAHVHDGKYYALALYGMKGTAYTHAAKLAFTDRKMGHLRPTGYVGYSYQLSTTTKPFAHGPTPVPVLKVGSKNTDAFVAFVRNDILGDLQS
jgi:hypothetical protein